MLLSWVIFQFKQNCSIGYFILCVCMHVCVLYVCVCRGVCEDLHVWRSACVCVCTCKARAWHWLSSSLPPSPLSLWRQALSLNLELTHSVWLPGQRDPGIYPSPPSLFWDCRQLLCSVIFLFACCGSNLDIYVSVASPLPTDLSPSLYQTLPLDDSCRICHHRKDYDWKCLRRSTTLMILRVKCDGILHTV